MPLEHFWFALMLAFTATAFALLEIQIEGGSGWARRLPTWRVENRWTRLLMGARPLTGYHLYVHLFVLLLLHLPYALSLVTPTWAAEMRILAFLILFWILEDFLWFVFNPAFGVRRFNPRYATWHAPSWWLIMPKEYWIFTPVAVLLYVASWKLAGG